MLQATQRILSFRGLLATLVGRELKARYRGSVLRKGY
jgi:ABC-type polysaccharide/polyol phosphate export permease